MSVLSDPLESTLRRLMKLSILAEVIKVAATAYKVIKLDVFDKNISLPVSSVKLATATEAFLSSEGISASEKIFIKIAYFYLGVGWFLNSKKQIH